MFTLQRRGTAVKEQDGRECLIGPGDFSISDASRLFRKKVPSDFSFISFHFPRKDLHVRDEDLRALTATAFSSREGSAALVATYFARMAREAAGFDDFIGRQFVCTGLDLLALLINERRDRFTPQAPEIAAATGRPRAPGDHMSAMHRCPDRRRADSAPRAFSLIGNPANPIRGVRVATAGARPPPDPAGADQG
ncbi:hypothetical protein [Nonomuraea sp. NPDC050786]|uniref:AraC-like ligand-binding domain-containing protein n=1 Tax=Nonomuraea sp. NPDC050786 TaxID=3154840 RepID=UPI0033DE094B